MAVYFESKLDRSQAAVARDGTIRIPDKYVEQINSNVRVVLFPVHTNTERKSKLIPYYGFDTTDYQFSRDEANAR